MLFQGGGYWGRALQAASGIGRRDIVELLLEHGANVHARGEHMPYVQVHGNTIRAAVHGADLDIVRLRLETGANEITPILARGSFWGTALLAATTARHTEILELLLDNGAGTRSAAEMRLCSIKAATYNGHENIVKLVLDEEADVNTAGEHGQTALEIATSVGKLEIVKVLLERGANVNVKRSFFSPSRLHYRSVLQIAVDKGFEEIAKVLLDSGATPLSHKESIGR
ncbi:ankyrin repeat-containing domain protein [Mycena olivaceomarginata]|nr:ankyrin repeat-containing domain protein [Mycena olivaceomarginata]